MEDGGGRLAGCATLASLADLIVTPCSLLRSLFSEFDLKQESGAAE